MSRAMKMTALLVLANLGLYGYSSLTARSPIDASNPYAQTLPPGVGGTLSLPPGQAPASGGPGAQTAGGPPQAGGPSQGPASEVPSVVPDFSAQTTEGKTVSLSELLKAGPVLVCFSKAECGTTRRVVAKYNIFETYYASKSPKFHFFGLWTNTAMEIDGARSSLGLKFSIAPDESDYKTTYAYGLRQTPTLVLIGQDRKPIKVVAGWDRAGVNELAQSVAKLTGVPYQEVSSASDGLPPTERG